MTPTRAVIDILELLPITAAATYQRGEQVYGASNKSLHLVMSGLVTVSRVQPDGRECVLGLFKAEEFCGESALSISSAPLNETAVAFHDAEVMSWAAGYIEERVMEKPELGLALIRMVAQREIEFAERIEVFMQEGIQERLATALALFGERLGTKTGSTIDLPPFTHEFLSHYVGTSREIVTHYMNQFRRRGLLNYSRRGIHIFGDLRRAA